MTSSPLATQSVGALVRDHLGRAQVFERLGIDFCCAGGKSLAEACTEAGQDIDQVCRDLEDLNESTPHADETDWATAPLTDLIDHILQRHHHYLREQLPQLKQWLDRTVAAHAQDHPELIELSKLLAALTDELTSHMMKEENVLFPMVKQVEHAKQHGEAVGPLHCGSIENPIAVMEDEHKSAGTALRRMRWLTGQYEAPAGACNTYRATFAGLAELETDLHLHIHKENNILFPRAIEMAAQVASV